jgi:hypothetical protein
MSQPPSPHEDDDAQEDNVIHDETTEATMSRPDSDGVSKRDLEIMKGIVDHLTEAKDEK